MFNPSKTDRVHDLLRISDLNADQLTGLLEMGAAMKVDPFWADEHRGKTLACFFSKPSTRTRVSLEAAASHLGMLPIMLRPDELQLGRGEPITDTAKVLSSYNDAIAIRTFAQAEVDELAAAATIPVINALTDEHHPCQALADLLTLREHFGALEGLRLAYVGDGNNVAHSLMEAGALAGLNVVVACPADFRPDPEVVRGAQAVGSRHGAEIAVVDDPREAVAGANAVYTDVWVSMGDEEEHARRIRELEPYRVDEALMALALPEAIFMHCLPAHRGLEVAAEVIDGDRSVVFSQAGNRLPTEQALIHTVLGGTI